MAKRPEAILLFSGGLDSTVLLAWARKQGMRFRVLEFDYAGRPRREKSAAKKILRHYRMKDAIRIELPGPWGATSFVGRGGYFPLRNLWFYATAAVVARLVGARRVMGAHLAHDAKTFPDARTALFRGLEALINASRMPKESRIRIDLPLRRRTKRAVLELGRRLDAPLATTWSCHRDGSRPCGRCSGCRERREVLSSS